MVTTRKDGWLSGAIRWALVLAAGAALYWATDERTRGLWWTSATLVASVIAGAIPISLVLATLLARTDARWRRPTMAAFITLLFLPLYLQAAGWDAGFGRQGWFSLVTESAGQPWLSGWTGALWVQTLAAIPWATVMLSLAIRQIDPELEEAASLVSAWPSVLTRVTWPLSAAGITAAVVWVGLTTSSDITATDLYQVRTLAEEVYSVIPLLEDASAGEAGGASLPALGGFWLLVLVVGWMGGRAALSQPVRAAPRPPLTLSLGTKRPLADGLLILAVLVLAGVPLANLVFNLGAGVADREGNLQRFWSLGKAATVLAQTPWRFRSELFWSSVIGLAAGSLAMMAAVPAAWLARRGGVFRWPLAAGVAVGIATPGPVLGLIVIRLLNRPELPWLVDWYDHSILAPVLTGAVRSLPVALLVCWYGLQQLPQDVLDAALVDGLTPVQRFVWVVVPCRWRVLLAAWLAAAGVAAGDLSASILVTPPGLSTLPVRVFGLLHAGVDDQVAGLCLVNLGFVVLVQWITTRLAFTNPR